MIQIKWSVTEVDVVRNEKTGFDEARPRVAGRQHEHWCVLTDELVADDKVFLTQVEKELQRLRDALLRIGGKTT